MRDVPARFYCGPCLRERAWKIKGPRVEITNDAPPGPTGEWHYSSEREWSGSLLRVRSCVAGGARQARCLLLL
jgi:hypothetical protein